MAAIVPVQSQTPVLPPNAETHPHSELPPRGAVEKRELDCIRPQPQWTLRRLQDPLPFPPTLVETLTYAAAYIDQSGYLAKYQGERFAQLDEAYHALKTETDSEIKMLSGLNEAKDEEIKNLVLGLREAEIALKNAKEKSEDLQRTLDKERAADKEHDSADHKTIDELKASLHQATDDLAATKRELDSALEREKALKATVQQLQDEIRTLKATIVTNERRIADLERATSAYKKQVQDLQKDLEKSQKELARKTEDYEQALKDSDNKDDIIEGLEKGLVAMKSDRDRYKRELEELKKSLEHPAPPKLIPREKNHLTAIARHDNERWVYFLKDEQDVRVDAVSDTISRGVAPIDRWWGGLRGVGWKSVDAFLPISGGNLAYAFLGSNFVKYDVVGDKVLEGPASWAAKWPVLGEAGLTQIDAALPWIYDRYEDGRASWFFQNDKAIRIDIGTGEVEAPLDSIVTHFPSLAGAGVTSVDIAVFKPQKQGREAYFFVGDKYFLVHLVRNARLYPPSVVKQTWKCLRDAGFY